MDLKDALIKNKKVSKTSLKDYLKGYKEALDFGFSQISKEKIQAALDLMVGAQEKGKTIWERRRK